MNVTPSSSTCPWSASTAQTWITINPPTAGSGNGTVSFYVAANTITSSRSGSISIGGQTFSITQAAATVADNPPTATLTAPTTSSTLSGTATFSANATDDVGVSKVEFWCDGSVLLGTDTAAPYSISVNTTTMSDGVHTFTAKAYDTAGHVTGSSGVSASVQNATSTGGQLGWIRTMTGANVNTKGVATDSAGNVIAVGQFKTTADFGGGFVSAAGSLDGFVAK